MASAAAGEHAARSCAAAMAAAMAVTAAAMAAAPAAAAVTATNAATGALAAAASVAAAAASVAAAAATAAADLAASSCRGAMAASGRTVALVAAEPAMLAMAATAAATASGGAGCRRLPPWLGKRVVVVVRYFEGRRVHWRARAGVRSGRGTLRRTSLVCPASTLRSTTRHSAPNPHSCSAPGVPLSMAGRRRRSAHMRCALVHAHSHGERLVFE